MIDQTKLTELKIGDRVEHFFLITKYESKITKTNKPYLDLMMRDQSFEISAKLWDYNPNQYTAIFEGNIIKVRGMIEEFGGQPQIKIEKIRPAEPEDGVTHSDFLPKSRRDLNTMKEELRKNIEEIQNEFLSKIISEILVGEKFEKYVHVPAGKAWHHAYIHGLLEHTLEIMRICKLMCDIHPELDRDLMITAAILHDFGKVEELTYETNFNYTDKGKLIGHIVIAAIEIEKASDKIENFPTELKNKLLHLVLSHQGKLEFAAPVEPKMPEAVALYHADELSAKTNAYLNAVKQGSDKNTNWTNFIRLANTDLYISSAENETDMIKDSLFDN